MDRQVVSYIAIDIKIDIQIANVKYQFVLKRQIVKQMIR